MNRPRPAPPPRGLCVVLHDVCPTHWAATLQLLAALHAVAREAGWRSPLPLTLLVVPAHHGRHDAPAAYLRWLHRMAGAGHELALHGWQHRDDAPARPGPWDRLRRRVYTAGEGEFAALDHAEASERLALGLAWADAQGLPMRGFVPPAWLISRSALAATAEAGFAYTCTLNRLVSLPDGRSLVARSQVFSTRAAWRRWASVAWNRALAARQADAPLWRLELHPDDARHPTVRRCWTALLTRQLSVREPMVLGEAVRRWLRPA